MQSSGTGAVVHVSGGIYLYYGPSFGHIVAPNGLDGINALKNCYCNS